MELTTHTVFAFAIGLIFFGRADVAFLVMLGALVPDLDRDIGSLKRGNTKKSNLTELSFIMYS